MVEGDGEAAVVVEEVEEIIVVAENDMEGAENDLEEAENDMEGAAEDDMVGVAVEGKCKTEATAPRASMKAIHIILTQVWWDFYRDYFPRSSMDVQA